MAANKSKDAGTSGEPLAADAGRDASDAKKVVGPPTAQALVDQLRQLATTLRDAAAEPRERLSDVATSSASSLERLAEDLVSVVRRLEARGGAALARPTHFVGVRMPASVRARLERLQATLLELSPDLQKAAVSMLKSHVTLLVTRVEVGDGALAASALQEAAEAWRASEGKTPQRTSIAKAGHFSHNGVFFALMEPVETLRALRDHVVRAFAKHGFAIMDEKADEAAAAEVPEEAAEASAAAAVPGSSGEPLLLGDDAAAESGGEHDSGSESEADSAEEVDETAEGGGNEASNSQTGRKDDKSTPKKGKKKAAGKVRGFAPHITIFKSSQAGRGKAGKKAATAAKKAVVRVAKSLDADILEKLDFGSFAISCCELVDMRNTQADGYYEVQALAKLLPAEAEEAEAEKDGDGAEDSFETLLTKLAVGATEAGEKGKKKRKAGTGKASESADGQKWVAKEAKGADEAEEAAAARMEKVGKKAAAKGKEKKEVAKQPPANKEIAKKEERQTYTYAQTHVHRRTGELIQRTAPHTDGRSSTSSTLGSSRRGQSRNTGKPARC
eukprot:TRINITY_DN12647_c0_g1_i1.p1 TRINITY_DN12647_c0_g1~~TRINITY_DN12647_c0_g1_i1.p1  ORF type:complete len:559 (-),score=201.69 TRINITY_DN12647_c0_g1_i1:223-1899(-)